MSSHTPGPKMCKASVFRDWRSHPCENKAKYGDYCGTHSPEQRVKRAKARGPTQWERANAVRKAERERVERIEALNAELLAMLEETQWNEETEFDEHYCLTCGRVKTSGHADDCELDALLSRARGEAKP